MGTAVVSIEMEMWVVFAADLCPAVGAGSPGSAVKVVSVSFDIKCCCTLDQSSRVKWLPLFVSFVSLFPSSTGV